MWCVEPLDGTPKTLRSPISEQIGFIPWAHATVT